MIAVSCPHPPLLLPGVTGEPVAEVERLRARCVTAIAALRDVELLIIVGAGPGTRVFGLETPLPTGRFLPSGVPGNVEVLPLSLAVGRTLAVDPAGTVPSPAHQPGPALQLQAVASSATPEECAELGHELAGRAERVGLLVMADGSARRARAAPGYLDERAAGFDARIAAALRAGEPAGLLALELDLAADLLVAGRAAWQVLAGSFAGRLPRAELSDSEDPFGVWYPVATWQDWAQD